MARQREPSRDPRSVLQEHRAARLGERQDVQRAEGERPHLHVPNELLVGRAQLDHQIEDIKTLVASRIPYEERPFLHIGQRVRVRGGALDGIQGILVAENGDRSLVISVEPIQRSLCVRVAGYEVEAV